MDFPGRLIAGFLVVVLILIFPLQYIAGLNNESIDALVDNRTHLFSDSVRTKGYLAKQMYEEYTDFLDTTGERYDIDLQDIRPVRGDEYSLRSNTDISRTSSFERVSYNEIQSFAAHTHTSDCYTGNPHVCNGTDCKYEYDGKKILIGAGNRANNNNTYIYYSNDGITWTSIPNITYNNYDVGSLTYMNGQFVMRSTSGNINTSKDGQNWTDISSGSNISGLPSDISLIPYSTVASTINDIKHVGNGLYYASGTVNKKIGPYSYKSVGALFTSTDLINWTYHSNYDRPLSKLATSIIGTEKILVAFSQGDPANWIYPGYYTAYINDDGTLPEMSLTVSYSDSVYDGAALIQAGDYAVFVHNNSFYNCTIPEMYSFRNLYIGLNSSIRYGKGMYLSGTIRGSSLINMTYISNPNIKGEYGRGMVYFGDRFIFSTKYQTAPDSFSYYAYTSTDGTTWTQGNAPVVFSQLVCNAEGGSGEIDRGPCLKKGKYYDNIGNEVFPICDRVVSSIRAKFPTQTVDKGNPINTTAIATYLDGHEGEVNCSSNCNPNLVGTQTVTLTYTGLVGNAKTTGTRTCTISVTVRPTNILTSITVLPVSQTVQKYSFPTFTVRASYNDGTSKLLSASDYSVTGYNPNIIGIQSVTISYTEGLITKTATVSVAVTALQRECPRCSHIYELNPDDTDPGCPHCRDLIIGIKVTPNFVEVTKGDILPITVMGLYNDGSKAVVTGWESNYNPERVGLQKVTVQYRGYAADITVWVKERLTICPVCGTEYPETEDVCPVCAAKVVRIEASPKEITIMQYEPISLTVRAFYADGSSIVVNDWVSDRTSAIPGTFLATVTYRGISDTISLTVLSINSIECPICGTIYDLSDSPKGCPICSEEIVGIEAYLTSGSNLVQLGTTPNIAVILIFRDNHREFATDGYTLENFNSRELGIQTITVIYRGFTTTIIIEVVNILDTTTCPNGHVYNKNSDGSDPGCPFCHLGNEVSNIAYFDITYTSEILDAVYSVGAYHFQEGNYISVIVTKRDKSLMYRLQNTFFSTSMLGRRKRFIYGGEVKDE